MKIMHVLFHTALLLRRIEIYQELCFLDMKKDQKLWSCFSGERLLSSLTMTLYFKTFETFDVKLVGLF